MCEVTILIDNNDDLLPRGKVVMLLSRSDSCVCKGKHNENEFRIGVV
jgi:hypothetical protein